MAHVSNCLMEMVVYIDPLFTYKWGFYMPKHEDVSQEYTFYCLTECKDEGTNGQGE